MEGLQHSASGILQIFFPGIPDLRDLDRAQTNIQSQSPSLLVTEAPPQCHRNQATAVTAN